MSAGIVPSFANSTQEQVGNRFEREVTGEIMATNSTLVVFRRYRGI